MKLLTKEQEQAHYNATLTGGILGGTAGLAVGAVGVLAASRRYQFFRQLTLPLKAFLITSSGTFAGIVSADHYSRNFERSQNPIDREYDQRQKEQEQASKAGKTFTERAMDFGRKERYKIVAASWVASMFAAFAIVNRNKFLTGQQKLVQARVYAQFLTVGVLVATAAFEISDRSNETGRYETITVIDPSDPEHKRTIEKQRLVENREGNDDLWKEMVAAEEERMKERGEEENRLRAKKHKKENGKHKDDGKDDSKDDKKEGKKDEGKDKDKGKSKDDSKDDKKESKKDEGKDKSKDDGKQSKKSEGDDAKSEGGDKKNKQQNKAEEKPKAKESKGGQKEE